MGLRMGYSVLREGETKKRREEKSDDGGARAEEKLGENACGGMV